MSNSGKLAACAACLVMAAPLAWAGPDEDPLIAQLKKVATQGQDAQTAAQVTQYVDDNQDSISAILKVFTEYLKKMQSDAGNGAGPVAAQTSGSSAADESGSDQAGATAAAQPSADAQTSGGLQISSVQSSSVQPSAGLQGGHLAGYPSLPQVDPVSSVTQMSAEQYEYSEKVKKENAARKRYLMLHPEGYTY